MFLSFVSVVDVSRNTNGVRGVVGSEAAAVVFKRPGLACFWKGFAAEMGQTGEVRCRG